MRCKACNKLFSAAEMSRHEGRHGLPPELCSDCLSVAQSEDNAENVSANLISLLWDELEYGTKGDEGE